jgi:hypothetical protein
MENVDIIEGNNVKEPPWFLQGAIFSWLEGVSLKYAINLYFVQLTDVFM